MRRPDELAGSFAFRLFIPIVIETADQWAARKRKRRVRRDVPISRFLRVKPTGYDYFIAHHYGTGFRMPESVKRMHRAYRGGRR